MRCKHPLRWGMRLKETVDGLTWVKCPDDEATHLECCDCHEHLPWGHSDEAPVRVEVRAAEIAADLDDADRLCDWTLSNESFVSLTAFDERRGWSIAETNMQEHTEAWHAGYLARCIVGHDGGGE